MKRAKALITLMLAIGAVFAGAPAKADPAVVVAVSGRLTFIGSASGADFWQRVSGIISFGPGATADQTGTIDASTGAGCLSVGTSFANTVYVCAPFAPGEVVLALNSFEQGAGVLVVNTLARPSGKAFAVVPLVDESPPFISPLTPLFWLPTVDQNVSEDEIRVSVQEYQADFFDVRAGYVRVNDQEAVLTYGSGIVVANAVIAPRLIP